MKSSILDSDGRLQLSLSALAPTSFPALEQALIEESHVRLLSFDEYVRLGLFAEEVSFERRRALALLSDLRNADANQVALTIKGIVSQTSMSPHGAAYLLYLLGAYSQAGDVVERALQQADMPAYQASAALSDTYTSALDDGLRYAVQNLATTIPVVEHSVRVKRPASILAKLVSHKLRSRNRAETLGAWLDLTLTPPYDIVGCRLVVECRDVVQFDRLVSAILDACRSISADGRLEVHRRYSIHELHGASILLNAQTSSTGCVPLQVQLWNLAASRYEWLCHGNHKINHRLAPLVPDWLELCARPIDHLEYVRAVARRWSVC